MVSLNDYDISISWINLLVIKAFAPYLTEYDIKIYQNPEFLSKQLFKLSHHKYES